MAYRNDIDTALDRVYARRRRLAIALCTLLVLLCSGVVIISPDLLSSILPLPDKEEAGAQTKAKSKSVSEKKRRPLPKQLEKRVVRKKKEMLRKRMVKDIERMRKTVADLERLERQRMEEYMERRDPRQDMMERLVDLGKVVSDKAHTYHNKNDHDLAEALDSEARQMAKDVAEEMAKQAENGPSAGDEENLKKLADKAGELSQRLAEAAKSASDEESGRDAEEAAFAASELASGLEKLGEGDLAEMTEGLADSETNPLNGVDQPMSELGVEELHELSQDLAAHASDLFTDIKAAEKSEAGEMSFADSLASSQSQDYERNEFGEPAGEEGESRGEEGESGETEAGEPGEMEEFAGLSKSAMSGIQKAGRSISRIDRLTNPGEQASALASILARSGRGGQGAGRGEGQGMGERGEGSGFSIQGGPDDPLRPESGGTFAGGAKWKRKLLASQYHISHEQLRQILPARRFSKDSARRGWFYLDTWYVVGPFKAPWTGGMVDYRVSYPPEQSIDLEANYGKGSDGQPLKWRFRQFDSVLMAMDPQWRDSAYYLYTELYFEEAQEMVLAAAADDTAKVWVNDRVVIQEDALSDWALNESFAKVKFRQGFNKILVRLQNGPGETDVSVILCTEDIVKK